MSDVEHILASQNKLGEGPIWNKEEQALYWVDIHQQRAERFQPDTGQRNHFSFSQVVTALALRARGGFVTATSNGFAFWDGRSNNLETLADPEADKPHNRFNDGTVDPGGRFWAGTMYDGPETKEPPEGRLYRLDPNGQVQTMETGLTICNGIGWSPDKKRMYFTDTLRCLIYTYDFDLETGRITNRRPFVDSTDQPGFPDGLTVDSQGFVWSARWGGWKVIRYDPAGVVDRELSLPVECPTSCTFGGQDLTDLYITSAWTALTESQRKEQPQAGDLFRLRLDVKGMAETPFAG
jgi:sugar lactone lactonase YvrE